MKTKRTKIALSKETLRRLENAHLERVAGGTDTNTCDVCEPTTLCTKVGCSGKPGWSRACA